MGSAEDRDVPEVRSTCFIEIPGPLAPQGDAARAGSSGPDFPREPFSWCWTDRPRCRGAKQRSGDHSPGIGAPQVPW